MQKRQLPAGTRNAAVKTTVDIPQNGTYRIHGSWRGLAVRENLVWRMKFASFISGGAFDNVATTPRNEGKGSTFDKQLFLRAGVNEIKIIAPTFLAFDWFVPEINMVGQIDLILAEIVITESEPEPVPDPSFNDVNSDEHIAQTTENPTNISFQSEEPIFASVEQPPTQEEIIALLNQQKSEFEMTGSIQAEEFVAKKESSGNATGLLFIAAFLGAF